VAQEVVSSLIPPQGGLGVLAQVEKYCQANNMNPLTSASGNSAGNPHSASGPGLNNRHAHQYEHVG